MKYAITLVKDTNWGAMALAIIVGVLFVVGSVQAATTISSNISTGGTLSVTGASTLSGDVTLGGGNGALTVTTTNSATSTMSVGCIQMYATSTDTAVALTFSTIATSTTMANGQSNNGYVLWKYGSCPF